MASNWPAMEAVASAMGIKGFCAPKRSADERKDSDVPSPGSLASGKNPLALKPSTRSLVQAEVSPDSNPSVKSSGSAGSGRDSKTRRFRGLDLKMGSLEVAKLPITSPKMRPASSVMEERSPKKGFSKGSEKALRNSGSFGISMLILKRASLSPPLSRWNMALPVRGSPSVPKSGMSVIVRNSKSLRSDDGSPDASSANWSVPTWGTWKRIDPMSANKPPPPVRTISAITVMESSDSMRMTLVTSTKPPAGCAEREAGVGPRAISARRAAKSTIRAGYAKRVQDMTSLLQPGAGRLSGGREYR